MTNPDYTAIVLVVDRSGSMISIASDVEGGLKTLLDEQKNLPGKATVDLVTFDSIYEEVYKMADIADATVAIHPRGSTALHDAVGKKIISFGDTLADLPEDERPGKVIFVVATDGFENASREFTAETVKTLVERQTDDYGWDFVFLGANQDAVLTGTELGFQAGKTMTFATTSAGVGNTTSSLSAYMTNYRSSGVANFTEEDRVKATE